MSMTDNSTCIDQESSHHFPKKYLRNKAFKKMNRSVASSDWFSRHDEG